jgi:EF hand
MKLRVVLLCSAALLSTSAFAADNEADGRQRAKSSDTFKMLDADNDGKVSKSEAAGNSGFSDNFDQLDGNSDGFVTKREYQRNTLPRQKPTF